MIEVNNLTKLYNSNRGIKNISFKISDGEILGLLGPNGSGKTTAMKAMLSLITPNSGSIMWNGKDIRDNFEEYMANTGALVEAPAIHKNLSAYRNVWLAAKCESDRRNIEKTLELVGLLQYKNEKAGKFSLGMKQRLGLAQAFISRPSLIILDEPVNGLDIEGVVCIRDIIKEMNKKYKTTFIISSHIASELEKLCTRAAIISEGKLVSQDDMEDILKLYPSLEEYFLEKIREGRATI